MFCIQKCDLGSFILSYRLAFVTFCIQNNQNREGKSRLIRESNMPHREGAWRPAPTFGPLAGLKVVDLTHVMAGPTCTLMLADMGADVIKVEKKPDGDDTRRSVPPTIGDEGAAFLMMNPNKRGIVLDLKTPGGAELLRRLARSAGVVVEA